MEWLTPKEHYVHTFVLNQKNRATRLRLSQDHFAKLTRDEVKEIRQKLAAGETKKALAKKYNVSLNSIHRIKLFQTWKDIAA